jgi:hypothetical protein
MAQGPGRRFGGGSGTPPTPAQIVQNQVDRLTKFFGLSSDQVTAVTGFLNTEQTCLAANATALQTAQANLVAAIKTGNATNATAAAAALSPMQGDQAACRAAAAASIYGQLTAAQQMQLTNGLGPLMGGGGGFGPRGRR